MKLREIHVETGTCRVLHRSFTGSSWLSIYFMGTHINSSYTRASDWRVLRSPFIVTTRRLLP